MSRSSITRRGLLKMGLGLAAGIASTPVLAQYRRRYNPVVFWSDVSLQLAALDSSIDATDARAPGPCASARALGLVHIVIADAVAAVYPADFEGFYVRGKLPVWDDAEAFVGGAAASIMTYIFNGPAHVRLIAAERRRFLDALGPADSGAWEAGVRFARHPAFTSSWDGSAIRRAVMPARVAGPPGPRGHVVDPFNRDQ